VNLLLDQMIDEDVAAALQEQGHDVLRIGAVDAGLWILDTDKIILPGIRNPASSIAL